MNNKVLKSKLKINKFFDDKFKLGKPQEFDLI